MSRPRTSRSRVVSRVITPVRRDPRRRCKACFPPPPDPAVSPAGAFPGWPNSRARQAGLARAQRGPGRTRGDVGENRLPRVTRQAHGLTVDGAPPAVAPDTGTLRPPGAPAGRRAPSSRGGTPASPARCPAGATPSPGVRGAGAAALARATGGRSPRSGRDRAAQTVSFRRSRSSRWNIPVVTRGSVAGLSPSSESSHVTWSHGKSGTGPSRLDARIPMCRGPSLHQDAPRDGDLERLPDADRQA